MKQSITFIFLLAILLLANAALQMFLGNYGPALFWPAAPVAEYLEAVKYRGKRNDAKRTVPALLPQPGD